MMNDNDDVLTFLAWIMIFILGRHVQEHATEPIISDRCQHIRTQFPTLHSRKQQ